jgi:hypothetical protein
LSDKYSLFTVYRGGSTWTQQVDTLEEMEAALSKAMKDGRVVSVTIAKKSGKGKKDLLGLKT